MYTQIAIFNAPKESHNIIKILFKGMALYIGSVTLIALDVKLVVMFSVLFVSHFFSNPFP